MSCRSASSAVDRLPLRRDERQPLGARAERAIGPRRIPPQGRGVLGHEMDLEALLLGPGPSRRQEPPHGARLEHHVALGAERTKRWIVDRDGGWPEDLSKDGTAVVSPRLDGDSRPG